MMSHDEPEDLGLLLGQSHGFKIFPVVVFVGLEVMNKDLYPAGSTVPVLCLKRAGPKDAPDIEI